MQSVKMFLCLSSLIVLVACSSTQDCDPDHAGLFTGLGCSVGGGYKNRTQNLQGQLQTEQNNAMWQQQNATKSYKEAAKVQQSVSQRRAKLLQIDNEARNAQLKLEKAKNNHTLSSNQLQEQQRQLDAYNRKRAQTSTDPSQKDLDALSRILGKM